jgi:hypothetical protein
MVRLNHKIVRSKNLILGVIENYYRKLIIKFLERIF